MIKNPPCFYPDCFTAEGQLKNDKYISNVSEKSGKKAEHETVFYNCAYIFSIENLFHSKP